MNKKNIIITGSESGIGLACKKLFEAKGHRVFGLDIRSGAEYKVDVGSESDIKSFVAELMVENIKIDGVINNAAIQMEKGFFEHTLDDWNSVFTVNVSSIFLLVKELEDILNLGTSIVNISSVHAKSTSIGMSSYVASKGAVSALTRAMSLELAIKGIRVNAILPGAINTPMLEKGLSRSGDAEVSKAKLIESSPLKRIGEPVDIANLAYFLCDDELSKNITGQEFVCDGGVTAKLASE